MTEQTRADGSLRHLLTLEGKPPSPAAAEFLRLLRARYFDAPTRVAPAL